MQTLQTFADLFTSLRNWSFPRETEKVCLGLLGLHHPPQFADLCRPYKRGTRESAAFACLREAF
jgi:hypothetical protein